MAKGTPTGVRIKRQPGYLYFVAADGEVRKVKRQVGRGVRRSTRSSRKSR
jgi:hypothetical protein